MIIGSSTTLKLECENQERRERDTEKWKERENDGWVFVLIFLCTGVEGGCN